MSPPSDVDIVVIGSGAAGFTAGWRPAPISSALAG